MKDSEKSESYLKNNLKVIISFSKSIGSTISVHDINSRQQVQVFLDSKIRSIEDDPDCKWVTTWNDYLSRLKYFFRWLHNCKPESQHVTDVYDWSTPDFVRIKKRKTKRISPYLDNEIWDREEIQKIITYEPNRRNKAIIALSWDLGARPHEITLLRIKHIKLLERYVEGQIPHEAKTGSGPALLTISFPYVRDWLNEHPFKSSPDARLICNLNNGSPIKPDTIWTVMKELRARIANLLENNQITQPEEREYLRNLIVTKKWNPYCIRHSAITYDSDYLPGFALNKKVRWSTNSRQPSRYIKNRMGKNLKRRILTEHGIEVDDDESLKIKQSANNCPRCKFVNVFENKYCAQCSYPLSISVYEEMKKEEEARMVQLESKYEEKIKAIIEDVDSLKSKAKRYFDIAYSEKISTRPTAQTSALVTRVIENGGMS